MCKAGRYKGAEQPSPKAAYPQVLGPPPPRDGPYISTSCDL
jgi:hypothetical protein